MINTMNFKGCESNETNLIITHYQPQKKQKLLGIAIFSTKILQN